MQSIASQTLRSSSDPALAPPAVQARILAPMDNSDAPIALAMLLHELARNAVRHGALSLPERRLDVAWHGDETNNLVLAASTSAVSVRACWMRPSQENWGSA